MQINYNEFMSLIPEETREYVKITMKYLNYFIMERYRIDTPNDDYYFDEKYNTGEHDIVVKEFTSLRDKETKKKKRWQHL